MPGHLVIRADGGTRVGGGHLMRCLALALEWRKRGGQSVFVSYCESEVLRQRIESEGIEFVPVRRFHPDPEDGEVTRYEINKLASSNRSTSKVWAVLDGYHFDGSYQKALRECAAGLIVIDDMAHLPQYHADILINQNLHAPKMCYDCDPGTKILLGTDYVLLRPEFSGWQGWRRSIPAVAGKLLVTLGGSDPNNVTLKIMEAVESLQVKDLEVKVVIGPSNPNEPILQDYAKKSTTRIRLIHDVKNMPAVMAWADVAVSAGGSTCWELAFMGLPSLTIAIADNQQPTVRILEQQGLALGLQACDGEISVREIETRLTLLLSDRETRYRLSRKFSSIVDGLGASRVVDLICEQ